MNRWHIRYKMKEYLYVEMNGFADSNSCNNKIPKMLRFEWHITILIISSDTVGATANTNEIQDKTMNLIL